MGRSAWSGRQQSRSTHNQLSGEDVSLMELLQPEHSDSLDYFIPVPSVDLVFRRFITRTPTLFISDEVRKQRKGVLHPVIIEVLIDKIHHCVTHF